MDSSQIIGQLSEIPYTKEVSWSVAIISLVICVTGIIGNAVAIFVIITLKEYQKSITHWYILHLAIADSIFLLSLPFNVSNEINGSWVYPEWLCSAKETILFCNYYASILFLMVMSIDRYIAVCKSFSVLSQWLRKRESSFVITLAVWIIALLLSMPAILYSNITGDSPENCKCIFEFPKPVRENCLQESMNGDLCDTLLNIRQQNRHCMGTSKDTITLLAEIVSLLNITKESGDMSGDEENTSGSGSGVSGSGNDSMITINPATQPHLNSLCHYQAQAEGFKAFLYFNFIVMFVFPLVVMVWCYGMIIRRLSVTRMRPALPKSSFTPSVTTSISKQTEKKRRSSRSQVDRRRVNIMCASLVSCFLICWLPYHAVHLAKLVGIRDTETERCAILSKFGTVLVYLNSALNPYLYNFLGTNFSRRWQTASRSFRQSVARKRSASTGSLVSFARVTANRNIAKQANNTGTAITKMSRNPETKHSSTEFPPNINATPPPANSSSETGNGLEPLNPKEGDVVV